MKIAIMKNAAVQLVSLIALLALVGCAATTPTTPSATPVAQSKPDRPDWTMSEPDDEDGMKHFVGISTVFSTEQSARDNAFEKATERAVQFLGNFARGKGTRMAKNFGLKADTINETIGGRSFQEQVYGDISRQLKAKEWYYEIKSDGYLYFVLTEIPTDELDFAIEEAIKKVAEEERKKEQAILNSEAMLAKRLKSAKNLATAGNLLTALKQLRELKAIAPKQPTMKRDVFITEAEELEAKWLGSVHLIAQSGNDQSLEPAQTPEPLKVHVLSLIHI